MTRVFGYFLMFLLWNLVAGAFLVFLPPASGLPIALALTAVFLWGYLLHGPKGQSSARRWSALSLRPLGGPNLRWSLIAIPTLLIVAWALGEMYTRIIPVPAESLDPFGDFLQNPEGRLAISIFAIAVAPIMEEFVFRGLIQSRLIKLYGPAAGIIGSAALFAFIHFRPWVFPLHLFLGAAFGFVVYATRSIWSGVLLHAANNTVAMLGTFAEGEPEATPTLWEMGVTPDLWFNIGLLLVGAIAAWWTVKGLLRVRRDLRPRTRVAVSAAPT